MLSFQRPPSDQISTGSTDEPWNNVADIHLTPDKSKQQQAHTKLSSTISFHTVTAHWTVSSSWRFRRKRQWQTSWRQKTAGHPGGKMSTNLDSDLPLGLTQNLLTLKLWLYHEIEKHILILLMLTLLKWQECIMVWWITQTLNWAMIGAYFSNNLLSTSVKGMSSSLSMTASLLAALMLASLALRNSCIHHTCMIQHTAPSSSSVPTYFLADSLQTEKIALHWYRVKVLQVRHFKDVLPSQSLGLVLKKIYT